MEIHMLTTMSLHLPVRSHAGMLRNARALTKLRALLTREVLGPAVRRGNLLEKYIWKDPQQRRMTQSRGEGDPQLRRKLRCSKGTVRQFPRSVLQHVAIPMGQVSYIGAIGLRQFKDLQEDALQAEAYLHPRRSPYHGTPRDNLQAAPGTTRGNLQAMRPNLLRISGKSLQKAGSITSERMDAFCQRFRRRTPCKQRATSSPEEVLNT